MVNYIVRETVTHPWLGISLKSRIAESSSATLFNISFLFTLLRLFFSLDLFLWKVISILLWALFLSKNLSMISNQLQLEKVYELLGLVAYLHVCFMPLSIIVVICMKAMNILLPVLKCIIAWSSLKLSWFLHPVKVNVVW